MKKTERIERLEKEVEEIFLNRIAITKLQKEVEFLKKQFDRMDENQIYIFKLFIQLYSPANSPIETEEHEE
jgi:hypothetical protein